MHHEGWTIVKKFLEGKREEYINSLLNEKELEKVYFLQAGVQAIDSLFAELEALVQQGIEAELLQKEGGNIHGRK